MNGSEYITKEDFQKYSETVTQHFSQLEKKLEELKGSGSGTGDGVDEQRITDLEELVNSVANGVNQLREDVNGLEEKKHQLKEFTNYLSNGLENLKRYSEHNNGVIEQVKNYAEHNNSVIETVKNYAEKVNEDAKMVKEYVEHVNDSAKARGEYQDKINTEVLDNLVEYAQRNNQNVKDLVEYAETAMAKVEKLEESAGDPNSSVTEGNGQGKSSKNDDEDEYEKSIEENLRKIAESAKQQEAEGGDEEGFLNFLSKENRDQYQTLEQEKKDAVIEAFGSKNYSNVMEADSIFEAAISEASGLDWYEDAPEEYKRMYESLDEESQRKLKLQARIAEFSSQEDVKKWWESRRIGKKPIQKLDENDGDKGGNGFEKDPLLNNPDLDQAFRGI